MVQTVFTQTFATVLDQMPTPSKGTIGLGTLTGSVGAVRTEQAKNDVEARIRPSAVLFTGGITVLLGMMFLQW